MQRVCLLVLVSTASQVAVMAMMIGGDRASNGGRRERHGQAAQLKTVTAKELHTSSKTAAAPRETIAAASRDGLHVPKPQAEAVEGVAHRSQCDTRGSGSGKPSLRVPVMMRAMRLLKLAA